MRKLSDVSSIYGAPLYRAESEDGNIYFFLRASDRAEARGLVRGYYPAARFFR